MQKVFHCFTLCSGLRDAIDGWTFEDGDLVQRALRERPHIVGSQDLAVGMVGNPRFHYYPTVLHALGDGWRLLSPPVASSSFGHAGYTWWLVRD